MYIKSVHSLNGGYIKQPVFTSALTVHTSGGRASAVCWPHLSAVKLTHVNELRAEIISPLDAQFGSFRGHAVVLVFTGRDWGARGMPSKMPLWKHRVHLSRRTRNALYFNARRKCPVCVFVALAVASREQVCARSVTARHHMLTYISYQRPRNLPNSQTASGLSDRRPFMN